jgi:hypothetical protein
MYILAAVVTIISFIVNTAWLYGSPHYPALSTARESLDCELGTCLIINLWTNYGFFALYRALCYPQSAALVSSFATCRVINSLLVPGK